MSNSKTKQAWADMKQRCTNPSVLKYKSYGAAGITFSPNWNTFAGFLADMGEALPGTCLDRIENTEGYHKNNCRWLSKKESARNTRRIKLTVQKVRLIKALLRAVNPGVRRVTAYVRIGTVFNVDHKSIRSIDRGENWCDVVI